MRLISQHSTGSFRSFPILPVLLDFEFAVARLLAVGSAETLECAIWLRLVCHVLTELLLPC